MAANEITRNISSGCALMEFEKIMGCEMKLSMSWTIPKTVIIITTNCPIGLSNSPAKLCVMPNSRPKLSPITGPRYGIIFISPANNPMTIVFEKPTKLNPMDINVVIIVI